MRTEYTAMAVTLKEKGPKYFEGILQLRNPTPEVIKWVRKQIAQTPWIWVAKEEKVRNGIDFYISSNNFLISLGKKLSRSFAGVLKTSNKLHTQDKITSKLIYRVTVLFKCLNYKKGQILEIDGEKIKIMDISSQVTVKNLTTGKKERWNPEVLDKQIR